jgi:putative hydrolase of the HAD superfamily
VRYRAVIFDLWQTLVPWPHDAAESYYRWMADAYGAPYERFHEAWTSSFSERATGPIEDNLRSVATALAVEPDFDRVLEWRLAWTRRSLVPRPDAVPTLEALRADGHELGLITVCSQEVADLWDETPFAGIFDSTIFSSSVGLSKPDPRIYKLACEQLGVEPADCLFVGDGANDELSGAERMGISAVQLRAPGEALTPDGEAWQGASIEHLSEVVDLTK